MPEEIVHRFNELSSKGEIKTFSKNFSAKINEYPNVSAFFMDTLSLLGAKEKTKYEIDLVVEEVFTNVAKFAYSTEGDCFISIISCGNIIKITFTDSGVKFNPLDKEDPDILASAENRDIGGLGIFMVKKLCDFVCYEYVNDTNNLILYKEL